RSPLHAGADAGNVVGTGPQRAHVALFWRRVGSLALAVSVHHLLRRRRRTGVGMGRTPTSPRVSAESFCNFCLNPADLRVQNHSLLLPVIVHPTNNPGLPSLLSHRDSNKERV